IVGDGNVGVATAAANSSGGLYVQATTDSDHPGAWQQDNGLSIAGELDFRPALTTSGVLPFTDTVGDKHTVSVSPDGAWGNLVAYVSKDTDTDTDGAITWNYEIDPALAQKLAQGEQHTDTFAVTVTDSAGGKATTNVTVTVVGTNETPLIVSGNPQIPLPAI